MVRAKQLIGSLKPSRHVRIFPFPLIQPVLKTLQSLPKHTRLSRATLRVHYRWILLDRTIKNENSRLLREALEPH